MSNPRSPARRRCLPRRRTRIGINTGIAVAGNMGTDRSFHYTIIGEGTWTLVRDQLVTRELLDSCEQDLAARFAEGLHLRELLVREETELLRELDELRATL